MMVQKAVEEYSKLYMKKERLKYVKEQILIRYLGLGWEEAYHPWSKNKHVYEPSALLDHLVNTVTPLQNFKTVPDEPPINLPKCPDIYSIGTKSGSLVELDNTLLEKSQHVRLNAMKERDRLESVGFRDQLMEMQEVNWPIDKILKGGFRLDMCFQYEDDDGDQSLQWCRGVILSVLCDKSNTDSKKYLQVKVKWDDEFVGPNDLNPTKDMLQKKDYNPETHGNGSWREDLFQKLQTAEGN